MADQTTKTTKDSTPPAPADKPVTAEAAPEAPIAATPSESNPTLEDKTTNDDSLLINQETAAKPAEAAEPAEPIVVTPSEVAAVPAEPVVAPEPTVVKSPEIAETNQGETENLQSEIEGLTGEIQALETKIERLTGSSSTPAETAPAEPAKPAEPAEMPKPTPEPATPITPEPSSASPKAMPTPSPITDIYSKIGAPEPKKPSDDLSDLGSTDNPTAMAMIGEVITILGIIITLLLVASPLFRDMIGKSLFGTISSVGWLTVVATLALGFLFSVLGKAKTIIIVLGLIFLLVAGLLYVGISYPSALGQLPESLDSLFSFYRP